MRAIKLTGIKQLECCEVDGPEPDKIRVTLKVSACGICGSDLHYWEAGAGMGGVPNLIPGHEFCGVVVDPGEREDLSINDRVTVIPMDPCHNCASCLGGHPHLCLNSMKRGQVGNNCAGAYAEYIQVRPDMVRKLPDSVTDLAATLVEPAAVALHTVYAAGLSVGDTVLITGGGAIGQLCAAWARLAGASRIFLSEINAHRRNFSVETGDVDDVLDAADPKLNSKLKKATRGGVDVAIETSASDGGLNAALMALRPKGRLTLVGVNFHPQRIMTLPSVVKELRQSASYAYLPAEFDRAMNAIAKKKLAVERFISRTISLEEVPQAFQDLHSSEHADIKIVIRP